MAQTMQDLQDQITAQDAAITKLEVSLTDYATDIKAAIKKLQDDIAAGADTTASVAALASMTGRIDAMVASLAALDADAETVSGQPTPLP